jgi:hypothetical protein
MLARVGYELGIPNKIAAKPASQKMLLFIKNHEKNPY